MDTRDLPEEKRAKGEKKVLRWLIWVWWKIGAIHQVPDLTNTEARLPSKGFLFKAVNQETCEGQGLVRVYQSASQLLYLTSRGQPLGPVRMVPACWACHTLLEGGMERKREKRREKGGNLKGRSIRAWPCPLMS